MAARLVRLRAPLPREEAVTTKTTKTVAAAAAGADGRVAFVPPSAPSTPPPGLEEVVAPRQASEEEAVLMEGALYGVVYRVLVR